MAKHLAFALALSLLAPGLAPRPSFAKQEPAPAFEPTLPWLSDLDEALAESKMSGKPILLEFR